MVRDTKAAQKLNHTSIKVALTKGAASNNIESYIIRLKLDLALSELNLFAFKFRFYH